MDMKQPTKVKDAFGKYWIFLHERILSPDSEVTLHCYKEFTESARSLNAEEKKELFNLIFPKANQSKSST
jgi:hypothetical protein